MGDWTRIARIVKTKGKQGSVVCESADGLPFLMREGVGVRFVPPTLRGPRGARVASARPIDDTRWEVAFEGIGDMDAAEQLVGQWCLAASAELPTSAFDDPSALWQGFRVVDDAAGELGTVAEVRQLPAQALLVVRGGAFGEVLVPAVDEMIAAVDAAARELRVSLPAGLLDLGGGRC